MFKTLIPKPMARMRLLCLPFAGAHPSVFLPLAKHLPDWLELIAVDLAKLPHDSTNTDQSAWQNMMAHLSAAAGALPPGPIAIYGHSMGANIALDLAQSGAVEPEHLIIGARNWPGAAGEQEAVRALSDIAQLNDTALVSQMEMRFGALPASMAHPDVLSAVLPQLRADLSLLSTYRWRAKSPIKAPIMIIVGDDDPSTNDGATREWAAATSTNINSVKMISDHYFLTSAPQPLAQTIISAL